MVSRRYVSNVADRIACRISAINRMKKWEHMNTAENSREGFMEQIFEGTQAACQAVCVCDELYLVSQDSALLHEALFFEVHPC